MLPVVLSLDEGFMANFAVERFVALVEHDVLLKVDPLREHAPTPLAAEGLLPGVGELVPPQIALLGEALLAKEARIGPFPVVHRKVSLEIGRLGKRPSANLAAVGPDVAVTLQVAVHVPRICEALVAYFANVLVVRRVAFVDCFSVK